MTLNDLDLDAELTLAYDNSGMVLFRTPTTPRTALNACLADAYDDIPPAEVLVDEGGD